LYGVHHTLEQKIINTLTVSRSATLLFDYQATKRWLTLMATESTKGTKEASDTMGNVDSAEKESSEQSKNKPRISSGVSMP
jgi:hypothetical protein